MVSKKRSWHLDLKRGTRVSDTVAAWAKFPPAMLPLPHPSWRNTGWLRRNPWFEHDLLPVLRQAVQKALHD